MGNSDEYKVMLSITILETHYVEATSVDQAVKEAASISATCAEGGDYEVFEVTKVKQVQADNSDEGVDSPNGEAKEGQL